VLLTDAPGLLPLLRRPRRTRRVLQLPRGAPRLGGRFDVVIACEVIYGSPSAPENGAPADQGPLLKTLLQLCPEGSSTKLVLAFKSRSPEDDRFLHEDLLPLFDVEVNGHSLQNEGVLFVGTRRPVSTAS